MADESDLLEFLRVHIQSVWGLELLLLLRADPDRCWTVAELVRELRASTQLVKDALARFERIGLVLQDGPEARRYAPASMVLDDLCRRLQDFYKERPVTVVNAIAAPDSALTALADAFRLAAPAPARNIKAAPWRRRPAQA